MKRSRIDIDRMRKQEGKSSLGTLIKYGAVIAGGTFLLKGCDSEDARIYNSLSDCEKDNPFARQQCDIAYQDALRDWRQEAPRYRKRDDCEYDFGQGSCNPQARHYIPTMTGFMLHNRGSSTELDLDFDRPKGLTSSKQRFSPAFNKWTLADGSVLGNLGQRNVSVSDNHFKSLKGSSKVLGRGGFGRTVSSRSSSSWGG